MRTTITWTIASICLLAGCTGSVAPDSATNTVMDSTESATIDIEPVMEFSTTANKCAWLRTTDERGLKCEELKCYNHSGCVEMCLQGCWDGRLTFCEDMPWWGCTDE